MNISFHSYSEFRLFPALKYWPCTDSDVDFFGSYLRQIKYVCKRKRMFVKGFTNQRFPVAVP